MEQSVQDTTADEAGVGIRSRSPVEKRCMQAPDTVDRWLYSGNAEARRTHETKAKWTGLFDLETETYGIGYGTGIKLNYEASPVTDQTAHRRSQRARRSSGRAAHGITLRLARVAQQ